MVAPFNFCFRGVRQLRCTVQYKNHCFLLLVSVAILLHQPSFFHKGYIAYSYKYRSTRVFFKIIFILCYLFACGYQFVFVLVILYNTFLFPLVAIFLLYFCFNRNIELWNMWDSNSGYCRGSSPCYRLSYMLVSLSGKRVLL